MIENDHEPDLGALIKQGYSSPLPEEPFVESLWAGLCRELPSLPEQSEPVARLPRRRPAAAMRTVVGSVMRHRRLALAAAAVVVALLALPFVVPRTTDEQSGGAGVPSGEAEVLTAAPQPSTEPVRPPSPTLAGERRPEADVAEASVIVRAKATGRTRATVEYRVTKVFKGKLTENLINVQIPEARAGAPYDPEKKYAIGQEVILFLSGFPESDKRGVWNAFAWWYDVPPNHRLDDREKIILAVLAKARPRAPASGEITWENRIDTSSALGSADKGFLGDLSLSMQVARASAIVRAKMVEQPSDTDLVCKATRVIYGRIPNDVLHVEGFPDVHVARLMLREKLGREPTDAELRAEVARRSRFKVGRDVILFLDRCRQTDAGTMWRYQGLSHDVPPKYPLDDYEKRIVEVIKTGAHLTPRLTPGGLGPYIRASDNVVRAELKKIGGTSGEWRSTEWRVKGVVHVTPPAREGFHPRALTEDELEAYAKQMPATIRVGLDPWRLRAESVINYRAAQDPTQASCSASSPTETEVQKEFTRLVNAELAVGQDAILFIKPAEKAQGKATYKLVGIVRGDRDKPKHIDQLDKRIREIIEKGEHRNLYL